MKILLRDFNAKLGQEDVFQLTIWNETLRENRNGSGIRISQTV
jgi:hypothetical protein